MQITFDDKFSDNQLDFFGKKALNLYLLHNAGMKVPKGIVVTFDNKKISDDILNDLIIKIGGYPVAVRSSGRLEDLEGASFAGLYETYLDVDNITQLQDALKKCFQSVQAERVVKYLENKKMEVSETFLKENMTVLIQRQINAKYAGVAFSLNPLSGKEEEILLETCNGLGEKLVSGQVTPSQYIINNNSKKILDRKSGDQNVVLKPIHIDQLITNILEIQSFFQFPQDIEWAIDEEDELWILQSRPITSISWRSDIDEMTNADLKDGGISSRVCTPMMFSLYKWAFSSEMDNYFRSLKLLKGKNDASWMSFFYGRGYWNAGLTKRLLKKIPGFSEKIFDEDIGIQKDYGENGPHQTNLNLKTILSALPVVFALEKEYSSCEKKVAKFKNSFDDFIQSYIKSIPVIHNLDDSQYFENFIDVAKNVFFYTETSYFNTVFNNSTLQGDFKKYISGLEKKLDIKISIINLITGLEGIGHLEIQKGLLKLFNIAKKNGKDSIDYKNEFQCFLKRNYHHGDAELELMTPRWGEVPERIQQMVDEMLDSDVEPNDPNVSEKKQKILFESTIEKIEEKINQKNFFVRNRYKKKLYKLLNRTRNYLINREQMREYSNKSYYIYRLYLLELGKRFEKLNIIEKLNDIFFLTVHEVILICENKCVDDIKPIISYRKKLYFGMKLLKPPNEFGVNIMQRERESYKSIVDGQKMLSGLACSPGIIEGKARVITNLLDSVQVKNGEILVTCFTDPGWTSVLGKVSAVVTEVGGVLSHAAVIGREYGIPAVLNIPSATTEIKTGDDLLVDGNLGKVIILKEEN